MTNPINPTPINALPPAPLLTDTPAQFNDKAFPFVAALDDFRSEINTIASQTNQNAVAAKEGADDANTAKSEAEQARDDARAAANAAESSAAFYGRWEELSGPLNMPATVEHDDKDWRLMRNLADVTAAEPGVSDAWEDTTVVQLPPVIRIYTSSGTWMKPDGLLSIELIVTGKGGVCAGGTAIKTIASSNLEPTVVVTVSNAQGGTTSFGSHCSATAPVDFLNPPGGMGFGGNINLRGGDFTGDSGGASYWGGGGRSATAQKQAYGAGHRGTTPSTYSGDAVVVVKEYY